MNRFLVAALMDRLRLRELRVGSIAKPGRDAGRDGRCGLRSAVVSSESTAAPTVAVTGRPTPPATPRQRLSRPRLSQLSARNPVPEDVAARFQAALADMADGGGIAATVMTPDGTWSGALARQTVSTTCRPTASSASPAARSRSSPHR